MMYWIQNICEAISIWIVLWAFIAACYGYYKAEDEQWQKFKSEKLKRKRTP